MLTFCVEANQCRFFIVFFKYLCVLQLDIQLLRGHGWYLIKRFNLSTFLCLSQDLESKLNVTSIDLLKAFRSFK